MTIKFVKADAFQGAKMSYKIKLQKGKSKPVGVLQTNEVYRSRNLRSGISPYVSYYCRCDMKLKRKHYRIMKYVGAGIFALGLTLQFPNMMKLHRNDGRFIYSNIFVTYYELI